MTSLTGSTDAHTHTHTEAPLHVLVVVFTLSLQHMLIFVCAGCCRLPARDIW